MCEGAVYRRIFLFVIFLSGCATSFLYVFFLLVVWLMFLCPGLCGGGGLGTWSRHCAGAHTLGGLRADSVPARGGGSPSPQSLNGLLYKNFKYEGIALPNILPRK